MSLVLKERKVSVCYEDVLNTDKHIRIDVSGANVYGFHVDIINVHEHKILLKLSLLGLFEATTPRCRFSQPRTAYDRVSMNHALRMTVLSYELRKPALLFCLVFQSAVAKRHGLHKSCSLASSAAHPLIAQLAHVQCVFQINRNKYTYDFGC